MQIAHVHNQSFIRQAVCAGLPTQAYLCRTIWHICAGLYVLVLHIYFTTLDTPSLIRQAYL